MALIKCPECGRPISNQAECCPHCGLPHDDIDKMITKDSSGYDNRFLPKQKKRKVLISATIVFSTLFAYAFFFALWGNDRIVFNLVVDNAYNFKNPTSVRVVSGTAGTNDENGGDYAFVCLTATNDFGAITTGYYCLMLDYISDVEDNLHGLVDNAYMLKLCKEDEIDISKINRRLALKFGN